MQPEIYTASLTIAGAMLILAATFVLLGLLAVPGVRRAQVRRRDDRAFGKTMLYAYAASLSGRDVKPPRLEA